MIDDPEILSSFHYKNGLCFERRRDGTVLIVQNTPGGSFTCLAEIDRNSWPSIVVAVGAPDKDVADNYHAAERIHGNRE